MLIRIVFHLLALLPLRALHGLGAVAGDLLWITRSDRRHIALKNIGMCLPELTQEQQRALARESLRQEMQSVFELPFFWLGPKEKLLSAIRQVEGEELILAALAHGRGVILCTLHLGGFEASGHVYAMTRPITGIYKPQGGALEELGLHGRSRTGAKLMPAVGGSVGLPSMRLLKNNEALYAMPDQDPPEGRGLFAPFFGVSAHTPTLVSKLAQRTGAAVLFMYSRRLPQGAGYATRYFAAPEAVYSSDLLTSVTAVNAAIERCVRECPQQYWWSYKRFRRRPPGDAALY